MNEKYDSNRPDQKTPKPECPAVHQYSNRSECNCNLEHRYAGRQSLMRTKMALGILLQLLCFFLNLLLVGIVLRHLGFIGIRWRLAESREYIDLGRHLSLFDALGFEITPLIGRFNLRKHGFIGMVTSH